MGEFKNPDINAPLYNEIAEALEIATADLSPEEWWEEEGLSQLRRLSGCHGSKKVLATWIKYDGGDVDAYYWFVRAGFVEAVPLLEVELDSDRQDDVTVAINGLLYANHPHAYEVLQSLFEGTHPVHTYDYSDLFADFEPDLKKANTELSLKWLAKLIEG
jgi:hypothetical protein